jgi:hypothetical protein
MDDCHMSDTNKFYFFKSWINHNQPSPMGVKLFKIKPNLLREGVCLFVLFVYHNFKISQTVVRASCCSLGIVGKHLGE